MSYTDEQKEAILARVVAAQDEFNSFEADPSAYMDEHELETAYDEFLDEMYQEVCENLPVSVSGSDLIRSHDPVMYRCGFSEWTGEPENLKSVADYDEIFDKLETELNEAIDEQDELEEWLDEQEELEDEDDAE